MTDDVNKNEKAVLRDDKGRWLKGGPSPSPGRPLAARARISERLLADLAVVWETHGAGVLERFAKDEQVGRR